MGIIKDTATDQAIYTTCLIKDGLQNRYQEHQTDELHC